MGWFTFEIFKRLVQQHPEVEFHFLFDRKFDPQFVFAKNVVPHVIYPPARHPWLMTMWYDYAVPTALKKIQPDLFISPDAQCSLRTKVPQLVVIHDINYEHYPQDIPAIYTRFLKRKSPQFCQIAKRVATVSHFSAKDIQDHYRVPSSKMDIIPNGANDDFSPLSEAEKTVMKSKLTDGKDYFVFVGSIHPRKNLQRLLPAFEKFKSETKSTTKLVIVGNTFWKGGELQEVMDRFKNHPDIVYPGRLDSKELRQVIGAAKANVYVSYFEGFGIPIIEGFKLGVPVITSNVTSMPEVAGDAALLVNPFSIEDIANALGKIDSDSDLRDSIIQKGLKRSEEFTWQRSADAMWNSILHCLSEK